MIKAATDLFADYEPPRSDKARRSKAASRGMSLEVPRSALLVQSVTVQKVRATQLAPARISRLPASHAHRRVTFSRR